MNGYLAIDIGGCFSTKRVCATVAGWLNTSQRSQDSIQLKKNIYHRGKRNALGSHKNFPLFYIQNDEILNN